jgi:hypothetical protein
MSKINIQKIIVRTGAVAAGAAGGVLLNKLVPDMNPLFRGGLKILVGAGAPALMGGKNEAIAGLGDGLVAAGAIDLLSKFGISGADDNIMAGIGADSPMVTDEDFRVNGLDEEGRDSLVIAGN